MDAVPAPFGVEAVQPSEPQSSSPARPAMALPRFSGVYGLLIHSPRAFMQAGNRLGVVILRPSQ